MARMFGFIGNRADLGPHVLKAHAPTLSIRRGEGGPPLGWGLGFYQSGEVLLRRRPLDERAVIDVSEAATNVRTDVLIGHVREATVGSLRSENTHPFRYRLWLFAQTGTIDGFEKLQGRLLESVPEFLRRNLRGETDSELFFYLFLSFLHDSGHLRETPPSPEHIRVALRSSISLVDRLSAEEGRAENQGDILVTNGEHLLAVHRDGTMAYRVLAGRHDVEELLGDEGMRSARIPSIDSTRFALVASELEGVPSRWTAVPERTIVTMSRTEDPEVEAL